MPHEVATFRRGDSLREIAKDVPLLAIKPASQHGEQQLERGGIDHEPESTPRAVIPD
jgi:hypothetical protein